MLHKNTDLTTGKIAVTFELPGSLWADQIHIVGEFNRWHKTSHPMKLERDGVWRLTLLLDPGREYQFRYLLNEREWMNDPDADGHASNEYGTNNSIVNTHLSTGNEGW